MLRQILINKLAIIHALDLEFFAGMTVLTGETGAGKSILLDALGLILGNRSDVNLLGAKDDKVEVSAIFDIQTLYELKTYLHEIAIEHDDELIIRRVIGVDGRSRAWVNGTLVTLRHLKEVGECLVDIHGQHAHQSLSKPTIQRMLLDSYADHDTLLAQVSSLAEKWTDIVQHIEKLEAETSAQQEDYINLLQYQIEELNRLDIKKGEYSQLNQDFKRMNHTQQLMEDCQTALITLSDHEDSLLNNLQQQLRTFDDLLNIDAKLKPTVILLENAMVNLQEASGELSTYISQLECSPEKLSQLDERLSILHEQARKHKIKPDELADHLLLLEAKLATLQNGQQKITQLEAEQAMITQQYLEVAKQLSQSRHTAAEHFADAVTEKMQVLGINGQFSVELNTHTDQAVKKQGIDKIDFLVSTNAGQPLKLLSKVASGGELSRLSLAIQVVSLGYSNIPTIIFDEVDVGIGGRIAEVVGQFLSTLATQKQILCVTHLAQVAAFSSHHYQVSKVEHDQKIMTKVKPLDKDERVDELARMLAGIETTSESHAHATKMLLSSQELVAPH